MARLAPWLNTAKPPEKPATSVGVQIEGPGTPSQTTLPADRLKEIQAAVEASPSKIAVIFVRDHQVPGPSMHASNIFKFADGSRSWDHVAVAWMDTSGNLVFAEARPINGPTGVVLFGKNSPGTATQLVTEYKDFKVASIDLGRYGPGARDAFVNAVSAATGPGSNYSLTNKNVGTVCSGAIGKGFEAAREAQKPTPSAVKYLKESYQRLSILGLNFTKWNLYNPKDAYLEVVKHRVDFRFDPNAPLVRREWSVVGAPKMGVVVENELGEPSLVLSSATLESETYDLRIDDARLQPATGQGKQTSHDLRTDDDRLQPATGEGKQTQQALQDPSDDEDDQDDEDALADDSLQDPETDADDDEDAFEQEETLASDLEHTPDPAQQPEIDDDEDELTLVSDLEDAPPAADDDDEEEPWQGDDEEEEPDASDHEDAPSADALMQATKADVGADATADDQAGPRLATSAPVAADDGFSFSLFPKPGVSTEVAKEAMPANQAPPEESSGSGMPASEGAHADLESADVGNTAPSNERVVHHGELAP